MRWLWLGNATAYWLTLLPALSFYTADWVLIYCQTRLTVTFYSKGQTLFGIFYFFVLGFFTTWHSLNRWYNKDAMAICCCEGRKAVTLWSVGTAFLISLNLIISYHVFFYLSIYFFYFFRKSIAIFHCQNLYILKYLLVDTLRPYIFY